MIEIVMILKKKDWFRLNIEKLGKWVLKEERDGKGEEKRKIKMRELGRRSLGWRIERGEWLRKDEIERIWRGNIRKNIKKEKLGLED